MGKISDGENSDENNLAQQAKILSELRPLLNIIGGPDDLIGIFRITEEFNRILDIFLPIAGHDSLQKLGAIKEILTKIEAKRQTIFSIFPKANLGKRKTFTDYYRKYPHYTIYETRPEENIFADQLRALIASLLPVLIRLEKFRVNTPEPFADRAAVLSRYLRQLSRPNIRERQLLLELPIVAHTPDELFELLNNNVKRLGLYLSRDGETKSFYFISRSLIWYEDGTWPGGSRLRSRASNQGKAERRKVSLETIDAQRRVEIDMLYEIDHPIRIARYLPVAEPNNDREEKFDQHQSDDIAPVSMTIELDPEKRIVLNLENRRKSAAQNSRFKAQAIEAANLHLPITRRTMSGFELQCFLQSLADLSLPIWDVVPRSQKAPVAAWAALRFFLSRDEQDVRWIKVGEITDTPAQSDDILWCRKSKRFLLPATAPAHAPPDIHQTVKTTNRFVLAAPNFLVQVLGRLPKPASNRLFEAGFEKLFEKLLDRINQINHFRPEISTGRLQCVFAEEMSRMAPVDHVVSIYFRGVPPNQHNPAVYSAISISRLQSLYDGACLEIGMRAGLPLITEAQSGFPGFGDSIDISVGSLHVPQVSLIQATVKHLVIQLQELSSTPGVPLVKLHNTYTAYVVFFLLATTGIRSVTTPLPAFFNLDPLTGFCFVSDKDNPRYGNARLVWFHPQLVKQIDLYRQHVVRLRQSLALLNPCLLDRFAAPIETNHLSSHLSPDRERDQKNMANGIPVLFFLSNQGTELLDVSPSLMSSYLGSEWSLRVGSLRHFIRTYLLQSNCSGELINALLGHAERGDSPWGKFSTLPPRMWRQNIEEVVNPCLKTLGFVVIPSPVQVPLR